MTIETYTTPQPTKKYHGFLRTSLTLYAIFEFINFLMLGFQAYGWEPIFGVPADPYDLTGPMLLFVMLSAVLGLAMLVVYIMAIVGYCQFFYRTMKNLHTVKSTEVSMSPVGVCVWHFIPIANLFMPFLGVRQIWRGTFAGTENEDVPMGLNLWWIFWLASGFVGWFAFIPYMGEGGLEWMYDPEVAEEMMTPEMFQSQLMVSMVVSALGVLAALQLMGGARRIHEGQMARIVPLAS